MDMPTTDADYLRRFCTQRDEHAFAQLVVRHGAMVSAVGSRICGNAADGEDCLQATFLTLALRATALSGRTCLAGWLHTVARHVALRLRAATITRRHREQEVAMHQGSMSTPADDDALSGVLDTALAKLPERYRVPILLHHVECRTLDDIASELDLRPGTVAVRLNRGREMLRRQLQRSHGSMSLERALGVAPAPVLMEAARGSVLAHQAAHLSQGAASGIAPHVLQMARGMAREMAVRASSLVLVALTAVAALVIAVLTLNQAQRTPMVAATVLAPAALTAAPRPGPSSLPAPAPPLADEAWVPDAACGWCAGAQVPLSRAVLASTILLEPDIGHRTGLPRVQVGSCAATWQTPPPIDAGLLSPLLHANPHHDDQLQALADGTGWEPARIHAHVMAVVVSPLLYGNEDWTPQLLARDGGIITCICDAWTDETVHRSSLLEHRAMAVDLGALPPGAYTLRFLQRTFHADHDHPLRYDPTAFDYVSLVFQVADERGAPTASLAVASSLHHAGQDGGGMAWMSRSGRALPRTISINLPSAGTPVPNDGAVHVGRFALAAWLDSHPKTASDLNTLVSLEEPSGPRYIVVIGPAQHPGGGLDICDAFWTRAETDLVLRVNLWHPRPAPGTDVIPLLVLLAPEGRWSQLMMDWSLFDESPTDGFSKTEESSLLAWHPGLAPARGFRWF